MTNSGKVGSGLFLCHGTEAFDVGNVGREGRRLPWLRLCEQRVRRHTREPSQRAWPVTANQTGVGWTWRVNGFLTLGRSLQVRV